MWDKVKEKFPDVNPETIVIAYYPDLYCARDLDPDFNSHERVHLWQQEQIGVDKWWAKYLSDPQFLLEQETEAYKVQGEVIRKHIKDRNVAVGRMIRIARDFSSAIYGNVISFEDAKKVLMGK